MLTTSGIYNYEKCRRVSVPNPYLILPMAEFTVDLRAMVIGRARTHRRFRCCVVWLAVFLSCRGVCADELRAAVEGEDAYKDADEIEKQFGHQQVPEG